MRKTKPLEQRFWAKVGRRAPEDCWEWLGAKANTGYGSIGRGRRGEGSVGAHRVAWELTRGPIPDGMYIDHICRNRSCVNPMHLQVVTNKQNGENLSGTRRNNTSGVRGVCWYARHGKWKADATHNGRHHHVGYFSALADAEAAVIAKRNELFTNNLLDRVCETTPGDVESYFALEGYLSEAVTV